MQLVCIPETFSSTLSASRIKAMLTGVLDALEPGSTVRSLNLELVGSGLLESARDALGGQYVVMPVLGPCGVPVSARYLSAGDTAVIAGSEACGMQLRQPGFSALNTSSYGVGELIGHALAAGHKHVIVSLSGLCCADAGCGLAAALGVRFLNRQGRPFIPMGASLTQIGQIQPNRFFLSPNAHTITVLAESHETLSAPQSLLAAVGAEQGVNAEQVASLEAGLRHFADIVRRQGGEKLMGLAGGLTGGAALAGMRALLYAKVELDPQSLLTKEDSSAQFSGADLIVAAIPELSLQSLSEGFLAKSLAQKARTPLVLVTRRQPENAADYYAAGVSAIFSILPSGCDTQTVAREDLALKAVLENVLRLQASVRGA